MDVCGWRVGTIPVSLVAVNPAGRPRWRNSVHGCIIAYYNGFATLKEIPFLLA